MEASEDPQPWKDYISSDLLFQELARLKEEGRSNTAGDEFFKKRWDCVVKANHRARLGLYRMTQEVGDGLASATGLLDLYGTSSPRILDLCMAPGGFSMTSKKRLPRSIIDAITLPTELGGHQVMSPEIFNEIIYAEITMFAQELVLGEADRYLSAHPDSAKFHTTRPYLENKYDVVFCGGTVCKDHPREEYRSVDCEAPRLWASELVFTLNRLKPSGSLVLLLHRVQSWSTVCLIHAFSQFSDVQLFKHPKFHSIKSSFYLVAKNIDLEHETAKTSIHY
ncbi:hypothetical protein BJX66DRAFT_332462 [Aspergillus keveii]|uniref:Ribosomal RNA methyltransferase FtsJ domain-containing protein n=1 Tax=Aspergillus keveii TaxID=714993 RepID=A0ABR4GMM0_9EURO